METVVGSKGQVVIAKSIRDRLGILPGSTAIQQLIGDRVEIRFLPPEHRESLAGCLAEYVKNRPAGVSVDDFEADAWERAVHEEQEKFGK